MVGYDASRVPGAWPLERVFDLAVLASGRDPANLSKLTAALDDPGEPVRWWAAQGCAMLRDQAAPAAPAQRILEHAIAVLDGKTPALVYPAIVPGRHQPDLSDKSAQPGAK